MKRKIVKELMRKNWGGKTTKHKMDVIRNDNNFWGELKRVSFNDAINQAMVLDIPCSDLEQIHREAWAVAKVLGDLK